MTRPKIIEAPAAEPISIDEARAHLEAQRYEESDVDPLDDAKIEGWISAAREHCENFLGLSLATCTLEIALDQFPLSTSPTGLPIELPMGPVREIIFVSWSDESDGELDAADYVLDDFAQPSRLRPTGAAWPAIAASPNAVRIRYVAGYGVDTDGGEPLPKAIRAAMLLILGHLYRNREDSTEAAMISIPNGAEALMRPLRVRLGMA